MIAPRLKCLVCFAGCTIPLGLWVAISPASAPIVFLLCLVLALLLIIDAVRTTAPQSTFSVFCDSPVRLIKGRPGELPLIISAASTPITSSLRIGLSFPGEFDTPTNTQTLSAPQKDEEIRLLWPCTAKQRGIFNIEAVYLEISSPWGLWDRRAKLSIQCKIHVYPNLLQERNRLASIFLNRKSAGTHLQRQVGKGRDFEQLREYLPGDSFEDIHWKATARHAHPITKMYQLERTHEIYVAIDAARLSARASHTVHNENNCMETQLDRFIDAALLLGWVAQKQGDRFGLLTFSDRVHHFLPAKNAPQHFSRCRETLYQQQTQAVDPDYEELFSFIRLHLRRRSLLFLLTNLDDPILAESLRDHIALIQHQHLVLVNMITPPGTSPLFSNPTANTVDDIYGKLTGHMRWRDMRKLQKDLKHHGVTFSTIPETTWAPNWFRNT